MSQHLSAEAGERTLVTGVDRGVLAAGRTTTTEVATEITTELTSAATATALTASATLTATIAASTATGSTATSATTSTATSATGSLRFDETVINLDELLGLALALTLGLDASSSDEVVLIVLAQGLGAGPLLVGLAAFVRLANLEVVAKSELLLSLLSEVFGIGDMLVLGLGGSSNIFGILSSGFLQLGLSNFLPDLLVLGLGTTFGSTPGLGGLLVRSPAG